MNEFEKEFKEKSMITEHQNSCGNGIDKLAFALSMAQANMPSIAKNKTVSVTTRSGGTYTFPYADLDAIVQAIREPLSESGLCYFFTIGPAHRVSSSDGYKEALTLTLAHKSGQYVTSSKMIRGADVTLYNEKLKRDTEEFLIKEFGGELTYLKRYMLSAILGLSTEDDDDGSMVSGDKSTYIKNEKPDNKPWLNDDQFNEIEPHIISEIQKDGHDNVLSRLRQKYKVSKKMAEKVKSL